MSASDPVYPATEQPAETGAGPYTERRYTVDIVGAPTTAAALHQKIACDFTDFSPDFLAEFEKVKGEAHELRVGNEFRIKILGPWNGTVRVSEVTDSYFELVTLEGHPEAGRIRFSVEELPAAERALRFEIHSWARSRDGLVAFAYGTLGVGKQVQAQTWVTFCERVVAASGGRAVRPVLVTTFEHDATNGAANGAPNDLANHTPSPAPAE